MFGLKMRRNIGQKSKRGLTSVSKKSYWFFVIYSISQLVDLQQRRHDELSVKLLDFLESPHSTTDSLLADKEQKSKKQKSKGKTSKSKGSLDKAAGKSAKKNQKSTGEKHKRSPKIEEEESDDEPSSTRDESGMTMMMRKPMK
ncbi:hypothetical protein RND71_010210 [Anisodus tanguticus]|uniref:Uncharacterized protein n=1 Tax=Anisodus tanguticus TaxID=243964 RepID=A0AAE1VSH6_9SOLA|nr:hypothetical protein RND71_010210 [Anisodus tanguticus]